MPRRGSRSTERFEVVALDVGWLGTSWAVTGRNRRVVARCYDEATAREICAALNKSHGIEGP